MNRIPCNLESRYRWKREKDVQRAKESAAEEPRQSTTKTMTYQSRPGVKVWDASPEEQEAFRHRAFEMAWKHVDRAPVVDEKGQFGKGIIYRREKGERFWYHGRISTGYEFRVHAEGPVERKTIGGWEPGIDSTVGTLYCRGIHNSGKGLPWRRCLRHYA